MTDEEKMRAMRAWAKEVVRHICGAPRLSLPWTDGDDRNLDAALAAAGPPPSLPTATEALAEPDREVDRRIGEALFGPPLTLPLREPEHSGSTATCPACRQRPESGDRGAPLHDYAGGTLDPTMGIPVLPVKP